MTDLAGIIRRIGSDTGLHVLTENASIARQVKTLLVQDSPTRVARLSRIQTLDSWLEQQARQLATSRELSLANPAQMLQLWEQVIEKDSRDLPDLQPASIANQTHTAWLKLLRWQAPMQQLAELESFNQLQLNKWCSAFEQRLDKLGFSQRDLIISQYLAQGEGEQAPNNGQNLLFLGSGDQLPPLYSDFVQRSFTKVERELWRSQTRASCYRQNFASPEAELQTAVTWAKDIARQNPLARIAILSTDSEVAQKNLARLLNGSGETRARICLPQPASDTGIFDSALRLLALNQGDISAADCRALIRSPFWGDYPADIEQRGLWEAEICALERRYLQSTDLLNTARKVTSQLHTERQHSLSHRLEQAHERAADRNSRQSLYHWAARFNQQLYTLGWPGSRSLSPEQDLLREAFNDSLQQLVGLDAVLDQAVDCATALRLLRHLTQRAQIPAQAPATGINILNTVESAVGFSHVWLLDASAEQWPGPVKPDPLIPVQLQLERGMPRCHPEDERAFCINLFDQLRGNCEQLIFSISQQDADQFTDFSPLLEAYPSLEISLPDESDSQPTGEWQWVNCSFGPELQLEGDYVRGGSGILNQMAASPFNAFATYRLDARPLPKAYLGIGPHHRGNILHACLDHLWAELQNSEQLDKTTDSQLEVRIEAVVKQQLLEWQNKFFHLELAYFEELKASFCALLQQWFAYERQRPAFVVESREEQLDAQIGPLKLRLYADRIDRLEDGRKLLIDYKSGNSGSARDLQASPPAAAQLPLYAISLDQDWAGVCFALLVSGECGIRGISNNLAMKPLIDMEDWPALLQQWREDLQALAEDYARGDCRVFEQQQSFARSDSLACLHRLAEYQDLMDWYEQR